MNHQEEELEGYMSDMLDEVKKLFLEKSEEKFINELVFSKLDKSRNFITKIYRKKISI